MAVFVGIIARLFPKCRVRLHYGAIQRLLTKNIFDGDLRHWRSTVVLEMTEISVIGGESVGCVYQTTPSRVVGPTNIRTIQVYTHRNGGVCGYPDSMLWLT